MKTLSNIRFIIALLLLYACITPVDAQIVDSENRLTVTLSDGLQVVLFGKSISFSERKSNKFYALPTQLKLGKRPNGIPEFLFLKFTTDEKNEANQGAILHMLMEWGLTPKQRDELETILVNGEQGAPAGSKFLGFLDVEPDGDESFRIISATLSGDNQVIKSSKAPVLPGAKVAAAARMDNIEAQLLAATFEKAKSITDLSVELNFKYSVQMPGAKGYAHVDWRKIQIAYERSVEGFWSNGKKKNRKKRTSYVEARTAIDALVESKAIILKFEEGQPSEKVDAVREAFMEYFLDQMTVSEPGESGDSNDDGNNGSQSSEPSKGGRSFYVNQSKLEANFNRGVQTFYFNYKLASTKYFTLVGNMASWYDAVKNNDECVVSENLNDPFYDHREIVAILDLDTEEIFKEEINHGTISVRKRRSNGEIFQDELLFDRTMINESGVKQSVTYARMDDKSSDSYEYKIKWSIRGNKEIEDTNWKKGDWKGITLLAPIRKQMISLEGDPAGMKENDITRAVMQVRYSKFGVEVEKNIPFSVAKELSDDGIVESPIFLDQGTKGYAYRIILNHKTLGKIVSNEWETALDDYVYFSIPQNVENLNEEPKWKKLTEVLTQPGPSGEVKPGQEILGKFAEILEILTENK